MREREEKVLFEEIDEIKKHEGMYPEEENKDTYWQFSYSRQVLNKIENLGFNPVLS